MLWKNYTKIKVRFTDIDLLGHVNNAKYFTYFEQARVEYFKQIPELDFTKNQFYEKSIVLATIRAEFLSPAYMDEDLKVQTRIREVKSSSFTMEYEVWTDTSQRLIARGESVQVYFNFVEKKSEKIPPELRKKFEVVEGREF